MSVEGRMMEIVRKHIKIPEDKFSNDANLANDLGVDSLTLFEIILDMEKEFGCEIPEKDSNSIVSIGSAIAYIEAKIAEGIAK
ncbi:MAG: acyl carrier protein [Holosporales bacterium]|jgi:acyl carrier protein|nr:acyl carrier protein [Holosporales bacterium]